VLLFKDDTRSHLLTKLCFLRQQRERSDDEPYLSLADFVAPEDSNRKDWLGAFVVTAGAGVETLARRYEDEHDDYSAIMVKALGDRIAEALAEMMHKKARVNWGYEREEQPLIIDDLIKEQYRGIRPAPGYPACPDHTEKAKIWELLAAEKNTGVSLTESFAMSPGSSVSGLYFAHPGSKYFRVGDIRRDQLESYAQRKGLPVDVVAKWLAPHLS